MEEKEAKRLSLELMESAEAACLTTIDDHGFPQTRAMFNLRNQKQFPGLSRLLDAHRDDFLVYLTTNTSLPKVDQIRRNPKVSVYYYQPSNFRGLMLGGEIEIVTDPAVKEALWQEGWERYYPAGVTDPDYTVLRLRPIFAKYYQRLNFAWFNLG